MEIIEYENLQGRMGCFRLKSMLLGDCCKMCINEIIEHYSTMHFITI